MTKLWKRSFSVWQLRFLCIVIYVFVYCDLCMAGNYILDRFMSAMYIMQSGLCIVFAHNGAVAAHYFPNNNVLCLHTINVYCVL